MALLIRVIGLKVSRVEVVYPRNEKVFTLEELQDFVGGYIEALRMDTGQIMWLNEDGKSMGLPFNHIASMLAHATTGIAPHDHIVGNVLITSLTEAGEEEPEAA